MIQPNESKSDNTVLDIRINKALLRINQWIDDEYIRANVKFRLVEIVTVEIEKIQKALAEISNEYIKGALKKVINTNSKTCTSHSRGRN